MSEDLTLTRSFAARPEAVFAAFTNPSKLQSWFWPRRFEASADVDLRVGGEYALRSQVAGIRVCGRYRRVDAPSSLVFSWTWDGEPLTTEVTLRLEATGQTTHLTVRHRGFESAAQRDDHVTGWSDCLDRLERLLAGRGE